MSKVCKMHYTSQQIAKLGIRPRERKKRPDGTYGLLPCEAREVKAVIASILKDPGDLYQYWRLIPFEEGYACQLKKNFERWISDEVENMWYDIGRPVFDEDGNWSCPEGGWWPYMNGPDLGVSWLIVGSAYIDMDEIWTTLRNYLEEKVRGYRMCPGMMLYRVVRRWLMTRREVGELCMRGAYGIAIAKPKSTLAILEKQIEELVKDYPTQTIQEVEDKEYYGYEWQT